MIRQLTSPERVNAAVIAFLVVVAGVTMAVLGKADPMGVQGVIVILFAGAILFLVLSSIYEPEPTEDRASAYYDDPIKVGIVLSMAWAVFGMFMGVWVAAQLAWPSLAFDAAWSSFGRLRPTHTTGVIFGFGGNALMATSFHVVQRTSRARLAGQVSPWFVLLGYNLFCVLAVSGYLLGITQSKEYAEGGVVCRSLAGHRLGDLFRPVHQHGCAAEGATHLRRQLVLHGVHPGRCDPSHREQPRHSGILGHAKSYTIWPGVQDAMVQWWYGHNAVAFFLTAGFLGMLYYYLPVRAQRPIFSYRLSILSFWGITFFYMWAGSHHLHYTALPQWVQTLGMTFSVMLLVPSWASAGNALLTLNGAWHRVRDDATLRFMMAAAVFYGCRPSRVRSWQSGPSTRSATTPIGLSATSMPARLVGSRLSLSAPSTRSSRRCGSASACIRPTLIEVHFWLAIAGTLIYVFAMWNSGIIQGLMWRTYTEEGALAYSFVDSLVAMYPYYIARAFGGLLFLLGTIVGCYNIWLTVRSLPHATRAVRTCRSSALQCRENKDAGDFSTASWNDPPSALCSLSSRRRASEASWRSRLCSPFAETVEKRSGHAAVHAARARRP